MKNNNVRKLTESAVMIALALVLNLIILWQMPLGGKVTLCSMLPIMLIAVKNGMGWGFATSTLYAVIQLGMSYSKVLSWGLTPKILVGCFAFDYLLPYMGLCLAGLFCIKETKRTPARAIIGVGAAVLFRFICHFISGTILFGEWENGAAKVITYSLAYNGTYLLPELAITVAVASVLFFNKGTKKLFGFR